MSAHRRHLIIWKLLYRPVELLLRWKLGFTPEKADVEGPCLVLCNHTTDWDPLMAAIAMQKQMYFVASEHIFRWGFKTALIRWLVDPISRLKGTTASSTVLTVMRRLKKGWNVCIFAEGDRTFTGRTGPIPRSTAKLARACGATLVTYRLEGGYLASPRWSGSAVRPGGIRGRLAGIYTPEQLRALTAGEVYDIICRDLHEDACERQRTEMIPHRSKKAAESLERVICICPRCGREGYTLAFLDEFHCTCGLALKYNDYGFFEGEDVPFDNVADWDDWQTEKLRELVLGAEGLIFMDGFMDLREVHENHRATLVGPGRIELYPDRFECAGVTFPLADITGIGIHGPQTLDISMGGRHYEIWRQIPCCMRKYVTAFHMLRPDLRNI